MNPISYCEQDLSTDQLYARLGYLVWTLGYTYQHSQRVENIDEQSYILSIIDQRMQQPID